LPYRRLRGFGLNGAAARGALGYIRRQISSTGILPDDRTIIAEYFRDDAGDHQLMIHSVFGKKVNAPLALLAQDAARRMAGFDISAFDDDDGILLFPYSGQRLPSGVIQAIDRRNAKGLLAAMLPATPLFGMAFRYNAARALMMGVRKRGRQPLWIQRLRGVELLDAIAGDESHPLIWETKRECLDDYWDLPGLEQVLRGVESGEIAVREVRHDLPSPMSMPLRRQVEARLMYEYDPVTSGIVGAAGAALGSALAESAGAGAGGRTGGIGGFGRAMSAGATGIGGIAGLGAGADGAWLKPDPEQLGLASGRRSAPQDAAQLHALLMAEGDQLAEETESPAEWLEQLAKDGRALYVEPGLWIAAEHAGEYATALQGAGGADAGSNADSGTAANSEAGYGAACSTGADSGPNAGAEAARSHIVRRALRYHGGHSAALIAYRYCWPQSAALRVLSALCGAREAVEADGIYYHAGVYGKAAWLAVIGRRRLAAALPPERYAALLCSRAMAAGTPREQLADALAALRGEAFSPDAWEDIILPARVAGYRQALLDEMLSQGEVFWRLELPDSGRCGSECGIRACSGGGGSGHADHSAARAGADRRAGRADRHDNIGEMADGVGSGRGTGGDIAASGMAGAPSMEARKESAPGAGVRVSFHPYGDFDWDARPPLPSDGLDEDEQAIYATLRERGAVFAQSLSAALDGRPPHGALLRLAGKGLARSDSLAPIRRLQEYAKQGRSPESGASAWPRRDGSPGALDSLGPSGPSGPSGPTGPSGDYSAAWAGGTRPAGGASGARGGSDSRADGALGAERGPNGAPLPGADGARGGHAAPSRAPARGYGFESSLSGRPLFGSAAARSQAKASARERAGARIQDAMPLPGRWELAAELAEQTIEQRLERAFDRVAVVCRETARDLPWDQALAVLRVWELTGRARRGYFIEGLPGAQFIRENDYEATVQLLSQPPCGIVWLPAPDPAQQWGKCLPHRPGMSFMNVPGTAVALCAGAPVAVFARFGQALRLFGRDPLARPALDPASNPAHAYAPAPMPEPADILKAFAQQFRQRRVFPAKKSVSVRQYSPEAEQALAAAGFSRYVREYVLYRE
jgi:hypothetical protein